MAYERNLSDFASALLLEKLGDQDRSEGLSRLHRFVVGVEQTAQPEADFEGLIAHEHRISSSLGGRSVFGSALRGRQPQETRRELPGDPDDTHSRYIESII